MYKPNRFALPQAFGLIAAIMVLVSGVTFAALRSQNNLLNGSRISSASANLQMARTLSDNSWYNTMNGFDFFDLMPGGEPAPATGNDLYLKNAGSTTLDIRMALNPARMYNPSQLSMAKTRLVVVNDNGTKLASPSLGELWDAYTTNGSVAVNLTIQPFTVQHVQLRMQLEDGAVANNNVQAVVDNVDLIINGTVQGS